MDTKDAYLADKARWGEDDPFFQKFYNKAGDIRVYGLACGYVQLHTAEDGTQVRLTLETPTYHVKVWPPNGHRYDGNPNRVWEVFDTLTEARKRYRELVRKHS